MKRFGLLMVLILIAILLAGCADTQPTSDTPGQKAAPNTQDRSHSK